MTEELKKGNVLVVDDDDSVCISIREILKDRFNQLLLANSAKMALEVICKNMDSEKCTIDLVISDICMSQMDGLQLLKAIKNKNPRVEVIIMTGYPNPENTLSALRLGASDYIVKPFQAPEVLESVMRVMGKRNDSINAEKMLEDLRTAIQKNYSATTEALMMAIDAKDNYTKEHCERVAEMMVEFSRRCGFNEETAELLRKVSVLHDIGKIGVREEVLNKNGNLTPEEKEEMKTHSFLGYQIVQPVEFLGEGRDVLLYHQERYDGGGYPAGLKGNAIPVGARMLAIVDSYDAMTSDRPYRKKMPYEVALAEIEKCSGTQFDPSLVDVFVKIIRERFMKKEDA
jgi:response regulator RpfG family c-di-GMP phosphodiesterase